MDAKCSIEEISLADLVCEILEGYNIKDEIPRYRTGTEPFLVTDCNDDMFKTHPEAMKAIPYKPKRWR